MPPHGPISQCALGLLVAREGYKAHGVGEVWDGRDAPPGPRVGPRDPVSDPGTPCRTPPPFGRSQPIRVSPGFRLSSPYLRVMSAYRTEPWDHRSTGLL